MSLKYFPNLKPGEIRKILSEEDTGYLCLSCKDRPYGVPISYAFINRRLIFHCSTHGRKLDIISKNSNCCFVVSRHPGGVRPHHPEGKCNYRFESVICYGKIKSIKDIKKKIAYLEQFKSHFYRRLGLDPADDPVTKSAAEKCACLVMNISGMTGRKK